MNPTYNTENTNSFLGRDWAHMSQKEEKKKSMEIIKRNE